MNPLEEQILKYEKRGLKVQQRRTLKYGKRVYLERKIPFLSGGGFEGVYFYYTEGGATIDSLRECFKDYTKFYEEREFGKGDKGFFLCSGHLDEKLFKDVRKATIDDDEIRNSIKPIVLEKTVERMAEREEPKRVIKVRKKVFIVHGRDKLPALELARIIENRYPLKAIFLEEEAYGGDTLLEKLEKNSDVDFAFITLTPDDVGALKGEPLRERGRQNVIFEWGLFLGKIKRKNICILVKGNVEIPSDLQGIGHHKFKDEIKECFLEVDGELRKAGLIE